MFNIIFQMKENLSKIINKIIFRGKQLNIAETENQLDNIIIRDWEKPIFFEKIYWKYFTNWMNYKLNLLWSY